MGRRRFNAEQIHTINHAVSMAEDLVSNHYKMTTSQWLRPKYDVKTLIQLSTTEIVDGPFAQIIRYQGQRKGTILGSEAYDFYKICLQDHAILSTLQRMPDVDLLPFCLYIISHELVHIVRFSKFLQNFEASSDEKREEEYRVHDITHRILKGIPLPGMPLVLDYYHQWRPPMENLSEM